MLYCIIENEKVIWYSGILSFELSEEDVKSMYKEVFRKEFDINFKIVTVDNVEIANKIMRNEAIYNENAGWSFIEFENEISYFKNKKLKELDEKCKKTIIGSFQSSALGEPHLYSYDEEAQRNLQVTKVAMDDFPDDTTIDWRITDTRELLPHNKQQFNILFRDSVIHLQTVLGKFRDLEKIIKNATTREEIENIEW